MWIDWIDLPPRTATGISLGVLGLCGIMLLLRDWRGRIPLVKAAGACAMLGFVLFYHRQYNNQMPPVACVIATFSSSPSRAASPTFFPTTGFTSTPPSPFSRAWQSLLFSDRKEIRLSGAGSECFDQSGIVLFLINTLTIIFSALKK